jgi:hypothetical protein
MHMSYGLHFATLSRDQAQQENLMLLFIRSHTFAKQRKTAKNKENRDGDACKAAEADKADQIHQAGKGDVRSSSNASTQVRHVVSRSDIDLTRCIGM